MAYEHQAHSANMRWLWRYVAHERRSGILALAFGMFGGLTSAVEPYLVGVIIDRIGAGTGIDEIMLWVAAVVGLAVLTVAAFFGQRHYSGEVAYAVNYAVRRDLFDNMLKQEHAFYQQYPTGDLISRMHADIVLMWRLLALTFNRMGSAVVSLVIAMLLLGATHLPLTLLLLLVLSVSTAFQMRAGLLLADLFERVQDQAGVVSAFVQDSVSGIQTIKTAGKEGQAAGKFYAENKHFRDTWLFFKRRNEPVGMLPNMISETSMGIIVLAGGLLVIDEGMSLGVFTSFLVYLGLISQVLLQIGTVYQRYQQTRGALTRLTPLLKDPAIRSPDEPVSIKAPRGEIRMEHVGVTLDGEQLLKDINLHVAAGTVVALVGPTGCGKTLLVNLLARVMDPTSGQVLIDGVDVREWDLDYLRQHIAYVPQSTFLFSQALHGNVRMGLEAVDDAALDDAVRVSRLSNDLPQLPNGMDTLVGEKGVMLSGGQRQRVAIARAVLRDPRILVLDDALSSVDMHTAADILADLRDVLKSRTSFIIAHRIATVKDADLILVMNAGRIVESGTHVDLIAQGGQYAQMVSRELREEMQRDVIEGLD